MIPISIVLIDSNEIYRNKLASILEAAGFKLLAQISYDEVEKQFEELAPLVAILAYKSSKPKTLEPARFIKSEVSESETNNTYPKQNTVAGRYKGGSLSQSTFDDLSTLVSIIRNFFN